MSSHNIRKNNYSSQEVNMLLQRFKQVDNASAAVVRAPGIR